MLGGGTLKAKLKRGFNSKFKPIFQASFNFIKEHRAIPILIILVLGLSFGLSRLALADTVTLKYKDESSNEQSLTLNKGTTIYLDPNFGYFKKDNDKRTKKLTLTSNIDLTNNEDINTNPYIVAKELDASMLASGNVTRSISVWGQNTTFSSIRTLQEMTGEICKAETTPTKDAVNTTTTHSTNTNLVPEARLKDTRDGKYYTVRKLAGGNCWMIDNLAYAKAGTLDSTDSDVGIDNNFSLASSDIYTKEGEKWKRSDDKKFIFDRMEPIYNSPAKSNPNFNFKGWRKTRLSDGSISMKAMHKMEGPYGNFYTWHTATAGTGTFNMGDKWFAVSDSICPRGWELEGLVQYLDGYDIQSEEEAYAKIGAAPLDVPFAGFYDYGLHEKLMRKKSGPDDGMNGYSQIRGVDEMGGYWDNASGSDEFGGYAYGLFLHDDSRGMREKAYGFSVRCRAEPVHSYV